MNPNIEPFEVKTAAGSPNLQVTRPDALELVYVGGLRSHPVTGKLTVEPSAAWEATEEKEARTL